MSEGTVRCTEIKVGSADQSAEMSLGLGTIYPQVHHIPGEVSLTSEEYANFGGRYMHPQAANTSVTLGDPGVHANQGQLPTVSDGHEIRNNFRRGWNSNPQPLDRQSSMLPLSYHRSLKDVSFDEMTGEKYILVVWNV